MTPEDFFRLYQADAIAFDELEGGIYSKIYTSKSQYTINGLKCPWVMRLPREGQNIPQFANSAAFSYLKWKIINPEIPVYYSESLNGWITPDLGKRHPNPLRVKAKLLDIYQNTGFIIANGFMNKNFSIKFSRVFCTDMDYAIDPSSSMSDLIFNQMIATDRFDEYFSFEEKGTIETKNLIKTLFYLEQELRHVPFDRKILTPWIIEILHQFREENCHIYVLTLEILCHLEALDVNLELINPETILRFMFHWCCTLTKEQTEHILFDIQQSMSQVPSEPKAPSIPGFFENLNKRLSYTFKSSNLSL